MFEWLTPSIDAKKLVDVRNRRFKEKIKNVDSKMSLISKTKWKRKKGKKTPTRQAVVYRVSHRENSGKFFFFILVTLSKLSTSLTINNECVIPNEWISTT